MSFLDKLRQLATEGTRIAQEGLERLNSGSFADGAMATCALIAAADGQVSPQERARTAQFISSTDKLRGANVAELRQKYEAYCDKVSRDYELGKLELLQVIGRVKNPEEARAMVQFALIIANADGQLADREKGAVREVVFALGLNPAEFGV